MYLPLLDYSILLKARRDELIQESWYNSKKRQSWDHNSKKKKEIFPPQPGFEPWSPNLKPQVSVLTMSYADPPVLKTSIKIRLLLNSRKGGHLPLFGPGIIHESRRRNWTTYKTMKDASVKHASIFLLFLCRTFLIRENQYI